MTLYRSLTEFLLAPGEIADPLEEVRKRVRTYMHVLAPILGEDPEKWSVTVEPSRAGVRIIVQDESGTEVDLDKLPADTKDLPEWLS